MGTTSPEEDYKLKYAKNPYIKNNKNDKEEKNDNQETNENREEEREESEREEEERKEEEREEDEREEEEREEDEQKKKVKREEKEEKEEKEIKKDDDNKKMIKVIIKSEIGIWEKDYNIDTSLEEIELDFKIENNIDKDKLYEFTFNNCDIEMDSRTLKSIIIDEDQNEIILVQKINKIENKTNHEYINYIAKPMSKPFEIYIFSIREKIIKKIKYLMEKVKYLELDKYGDDSSYCNGINRLFISGGTDPITNQILNFFVDIDIANNKLKKKLKMPIPKRNHSMIYYDEKVYIIGGNNEETMFYDIKNTEILKWAKLNKKKYAPSLIINEPYIYCFDFSHKFYNEFNIEKINLISTNPKWEILKPKFDSNMTKLISAQKYFGLVKNYEENIILLGGAESQNINNNIILKYNVDENLIEKYKDLKLINIQNNKDLIFNEKSFLSLNENTDIIFPYFIQRNPKILYYHKDKNELELIVYHSKPQLKENYKNNEPLNGMKINTSIVNKNNFINKSIDNKIKSKKNKKANIKEGKENNRDNENNIPIPIINNISIEKNKSDKESKEDDNININNNKENIDINKKSEKEESQNSKKDKEEKEEKEDKEEKESNKNSSKNSKENEESINKEKNSNRSSDKRTEENNDNSDNNSETHNEIKEEKKDEIDDININKEINYNKIFIQNKDNFHSSVNMQYNFDKLDNNKAVKNNLKQLNIVEPNDINVKYLKKVRRQFNNAEINDSDDFDNY